MDEHDEETYGLLSELAACVAHVGSHVLPYISSKKDDDYCFFFSDDESFKEARTILRGRRKPREWGKEYVDFHLLNPNHRLIELSYAYQSHFIVVLKGEKLDGENIDFLSMGNEWKANMARQFDAKKGKNGKDGIIQFKSWYHIYTGLCFLENGKYELTDEQISNVNHLHSREYDERRSELVEWCISQLRS